MAFDYSELRGIAKDLIDEFGRTMTLVKLNETPDNPAQPWRGTATPRSAAISVAGKAVVADAAALTAFGFEIPTEQRPEQVILFAAENLVSFPGEETDELIDGARTWRVTKTHKLAPGDTELLYAFEVNR